MHRLLKRKFRDKRPKGVRREADYRNTGRLKLEVELFFSWRGETDVALEQLVKDYEESGCPLGF
ncbi:hypothetical protein TorRG33x02_005340 [Trema orientale]|uniref:Uncharacterized protein n=1 Tax=Trema orientale TaxID=63057 RepID=A0A2P5FZZ3_TREOI|nr:hypothetical protein TorRG33x02_005340 [Trema orientale]